MEFLPLATILQLKSQHAYMVNLPGCDNYRSTRPRVPFHFEILNQLLGRDAGLPQVLELATEINCCPSLLPAPAEASRGMGGGGSARYRNLPEITGPSQEEPLRGMLISKQAE